jgi:hypothetical protein
VTVLQKALDLFMAAAAWSHADAVNEAAPPAAEGRKCFIILLGLLKFVIQQNASIVIVLARGHALRGQAQRSPIVDLCSVSFV